MRKFVGNTNINPPSTTSMATTRKLKVDFKIYFNPTDLGLKTKLLRIFFHNLLPTELNLPLFFHWQYQGFCNKYTQLYMDGNL